MTNDWNLIAAYEVLITVALRPGETVMLMRSPICSLRVPVVNTCYLNVLVVNLTFIGAVAVFSQILCKVAPAIMFHIIMLLRSLFYLTVDVALCVRFESALLTVDKNLHPYGYNGKPGECNVFS